MLFQAHQAKAERGQRAVALIDGDGQAADAAPRAQQVDDDGRIGEARVPGRCGDTPKRRSVVAHSSVRFLRLCACTCRYAALMHYIGAGSRTQPPPVLELRHMFIPCKQLRSAQSLWQGQRTICNAPDDAVLPSQRRRVVYALHQTHIALTLLFDHTTFSSTGGCAQPCLHDVSTNIIHPCMQGPSAHTCAKRG